MSIKLKSKNKIAIVGDNLLDLSKVDADDLNIILQHEGLLPISQGERDFLTHLHDSLHTTTEALQTALLLLEEEADTSTEEYSVITASFRRKIRDNIGVLAVKIDDIGKGYVIKKERV